MSAKVKIEFAVPMGMVVGDYAKLYSNAGVGNIDWDTPVDNRRIELMPGDSGIFGWGHQAWGSFRWGHAQSRNTVGWGHLPWGSWPWGYGTVMVEVDQIVEDCGDYKYGLKLYDGLDNSQIGNAGDVSLAVHIAPAAPTGLKKISYDKNSDVLILEAL